MNTVALAQANLFPPRRIIMERKMGDEHFHLEILDQTFVPQDSKSLLQETMYDPGTQSSDTYYYEKPIYGNLAVTDSINMDRGLLAQNHESSYSSWCTNSEGVAKLWPNQHQEAMGNDRSDVNSPPLWRNGPSPPHPLLSRQNHRPLSPNSRMQAIARGQRELMEMVKNMPESSYELTLKDIVEHQAQAPLPEERSPNNNQSLHQREGARARRQERKKSDERNVVRSGSFENRGLFLNMAFPFTRKSKKEKYVRNTSGKVSPRPEVVKGGGEKDWWKKKFTGSGDSDSSRTTNNSSSSSCTRSSGGLCSGSSNNSGKKRNHVLTGCRQIFHFWKCTCVCCSKIPRCCLSSRC